MDLSNKVVVVTGAGSGIGEALARGAADRGARHVVVADLNEAEANRVAADIAGTGVGSTGVGIDVRDEAAIVAMVEATEAAHGPIDLFASNAGYVTTGGVEDSNERIQAMWEVHVLSHLYAARAALPSMIANGGGYFLNTASAAGLLTQLGSLSYSITKSAAISLGEWLAISHHHQGIRVSMLCPQAVRTNILLNSPDQERADSVEGEDDGWGGGVASGDGVLSPAEVADACFEAMDEERFHVLPHDEVQTYMERKATDVDRWLGGMRRFQDMLYADGPLPGDAIAPEV